MSNYITLLASVPARLSACLPVCLVM